MVTVPGCVLDGRCTQVCIRWSLYLGVHLMVAVPRCVFDGLSTQVCI